MTIAANVTRVRARIAEACATAGRDPKSITLVAVSKHRSPDAILEAGTAGLVHFGENRVEEAREKVPDLRETAPALTWHMIGHIQSRKAREVVNLFDVVHSVDSVKLAQRLSRFTTGAPLPIMLEVNISGETAKYGWSVGGWPDDRDIRRAFWDDVAAVAALPNLQLAGLMTMAPIVPNMELTRPIFVEMRRLRDALANDFPAARWQHLSMGMTDDFPVAVEEGATQVRIGRAIFETAAHSEKRG